MKRLIPLIGLVVLVVILAGSSASAVPDSDTPPAPSIPDGALLPCQTESINSPASAGITITMYAVDDKA